MIRAAAVLVVLITLLSIGGWSQPVTAENVLVANNANITFIDADNDGKESADDCYLNATMDPGGSNLMISGTQTNTSNKLVACNGYCMGSAFASSDFAEVKIAACTYSRRPFVPLLAEFCEASECTSSDDTGHSGAVGRAAGEPPLTLHSGAIFYEETMLAGSGVVCDAGGPAVQITDIHGNTVLRDLFPFPDAKSPTHMCAANVPVQLVSGGFVFRMACMPVAGGVSALTLSGDSMIPLAQIDFDNLGPCPGRAQRAPTASEWGLIGLGLSLLLGGTWLLSRRARFAGSLPLV